MTDSDSPIRLFSNQKFRSTLLNQTFLEFTENLKITTSFSSTWMQVVCL